jgi:hypothetical protein
MTPLIEPYGPGSHSKIQRIKNLNPFFWGNISHRLCRAGDAVERRSLLTLPEHPAEITTYEATDADHLYHLRKEAAASFFFFSALHSSAA